MHLAIWLLLAKILLVEPQDATESISKFSNVTNRTKKMKEKTCPSTCQLRRKIGKLQNYIEFRFVNIEANFDAINQSLKRNSSQDSDENRRPLQRSSVSDVTYQENEETSYEVYEQVIATMNASIRRLTRQNAILQRQAKEARDLSDVVRSQNHILASQNRGLRVHSNNVDVRIQQFRRQIEALEEAVTHLNQTRFHEIKRPQLTELESLAERNKVNLVNAENRISVLEEWTRIASESGSVPPIATTTSHPQPETPPNDCQELLQMGYKTSGIYRIRPWRAQSSFDVYCEQKYYQGGWTVIQRRKDGSVNFDRGWDDYESGFGDLESEFWLGNNKIHQLTNQNTYRLHVVLQDWNNERAYAEYDGFRLSSSRDYYSVRFGRYEGTAGDALRGRSSDGSTNLYLSRFGTRDSDNDSCTPCLYEGERFENCARFYNGGWWFRACADSNLNGNYITPDNRTSCAGGNCFGVRWSTWHDEEGYSLKASIMMVRVAGSQEEN